MSLAQTYTFYDLRQHAASDHIDLILPDWRGTAEHVVILSPHDDDAALGAGYLIAATQAHGAKVSVVIVCDGRAGYSTPDQRDTIVATRRGETYTAYQQLGLTPGDIHRLDFPDFSAASHIGWHLPHGATGSFADTIPLLRTLHTTRLLIPNGYREHADHEAVARMGSFDAPQVGDPVVADWGAPTHIHTVLEYAVWGDFTPEDALVTGAPTTLRANRALAAPEEIEQTVRTALEAYVSQHRIIADMVQARNTRRLPDGRYLEVYRWLDPRPPLDYAPYRDAVEQITRLA